MDFGPNTMFKEMSLPGPFKLYFQSKMLKRAANPVLIEFKSPFEMLLPKQLILVCIY